MGSRLIITGIAADAVDDLSEMPDVQICRRTRAAARILQHEQPVVGRVHSCYDHTVNIRTPSGRILTLQAEGLLRAPLAISLAGEMEELLPFPPVGTPVVQHIQNVDVGPGALKLIFSGTTEWDGRVHPMTQPTAFALSGKAEELSAWLMRHASGCGLAIVLPHLEGTVGHLSFVNRKMVEVIRPFLAGRELSADFLFEIVDRLLGLGEGLTPSGDDLLVGLIVVLHKIGMSEASLPSARHGRFLQEVMAKTSDLSSEFLRCGMEGDFAEPLVLLVDSLFAQEPDVWPLHAANLAAWGHSSGVDAMVGMVLGCRLAANFLV
jgi:hypothetical protein